jgi:5-(carboxyamino)imidazole ribonucleotide synthase
MKTIGIVGGGQLAQMMTLAAKPLGFKVVVIDTSANSPAAQAGAEEIIAKDGKDQAALNQLVDQCDVITTEFEEMFDISMLEPIAEAGKAVHPSPSTIKLIKDKLQQKRFLRSHEIPVGSFAEITSQQQAETLLQEFAGKIVIKTRRGGYDGNGNAVAETVQDIADAFKRFDGRPLYAEQFVPFTKELAVMVARSVSGETAVYPVVETSHVRNICSEVIAPAVISEAEQNKALAVAKSVAQRLKGAGVFGIEMFLTRDGEVLVNEISPRVHNSGHYTIEACVTSQFEQHIRAITGMSLGKTDLKVPAAVMINILGERDGPVELKGLEEVEATPDTYIHIYGKSPTRIDRKMGHITSTSKDVEQALEHARKARKLISI